MWQAMAWAAWALSGAVFLWIFWDFMRVNIGYSEQTLLSSREGVDELFREGDLEKR